MLPHVPSVQMQVIPDDIMNVDRFVDEDSDPNKRISQAQNDRRVVDERELSDSEDENGDKRRNRSNGRKLFHKRKASSETINGTVVNGNENIFESNSTINKTGTKITKFTESIYNIPTTKDGMNENISFDQIKTLVKNEPSTIGVDECVSRDVNTSETI